MSISFLYSWSSYIIIFIYYIADNHSRTTIVQELNVCSFLLIPPKRTGKPGHTIGETETRGKAKGDIFWPHCSLFWKDQMGVHRRQRNWKEKKRLVFEWEKMKIWWVVSDDVCKYLNLNFSNQVMFLKMFSTHSRTCFERGHLERNLFLYIVHF